MSRHTKMLMAKIERRLDKYVGLCETACGFPENIAEANRAGDELMDFIKAEIEKLVQKAGME